MHLRSSFKFNVTSAARLFQKHYRKEEEEEEEKEPKKKLNTLHTYRISRYILIIIT